MNCKSSILLDRILSSDEADEDHDDRYDQEDVDEASNGVGCDESQKPQDQEYNSDGGKHGFSVIL